jgi:hypothetical protein
LGRCCQLTSVSQLEADRAGATGGHGSNLSCSAVGRMGHLFAYSYLGLSAFIIIFPSKHML